ncbi:FUSC family protein [Streptomyces wuyuanensis]|uniref:FUSC family protein n=1 Tax=Streptomyces wuyuanensis TaxID=1196353 RepID=UPI00343AE3BA
MRDRRGAVPPGERLRTACAAADPGMVRFLAACNTAGAILLSLGVLLALGAPEPLLVVAAATALVWSFVLTAPTVREQALAHALGLPVALLSATVAVLLAPYRVAADAVFVLLIFVTVYVRAYGTLGTALGMNAFQLYFVAQFVPLRPDQLPGLWGAVTVAFAAGALVRFGVLRAPPGRTLARLRGSVGACLNQVVDALIEVAGGGPPVPPRRLGDLHRALARLHECALMVQGTAESVLAPSAAAELRRRVARTDVAAQRLSVRLLRAIEADDPEGRLSHDAAHRLHLQGRGAAPTDPAHTVGPGAPVADPRTRDAFVRELRSVRARPAAAPADGPSGPSPHASAPGGPRPGAREPAAVASARSALEDFAAAVPRLWAEFSAAAAAAHPGRRESASGSSGSSGGCGGPPVPGPRGLRRPATRAAFQVAAGSALAIVCGELISPERWYWAVLACWMVFFNTASTGEIMVKGYRRVLGTLAGVVVGLGAAAFAGGDPWLAFVLVMACVFGMAFTAPWSYAVGTFFVTLMLGSLYSLLHTYTTGVLVVRIEETVLGVVCGVLAALVVLPIGTGARADRYLHETLLRLGDAVRGLHARLTAREAGHGAGAGECLELARELDESLERLRASVTPLTHPLAPQRLRRGRALYTLGLLDTCAYHVRALAVAVPETRAGTGRAQAAAEPLDEVVARLDTNLRSLADRVSGGTPAPLRAAPGVTRRGGPVPPESPAGRIVAHFGRLDDDVLALGGPLGVPEAGTAAPGPSARAAGGPRAA